MGNILERLGVRFDHFRQSYAVANNSGKETNISTLDWENAQEKDRMVVRNNAARNSISKCFAYVDSRGNMVYSYAKSSNQIPDNTMNLIKEAREFQ